MKVGKEYDGTGDALVVLTLEAETSEEQEALAKLFAPVNHNSMPFHKRQGQRRQEGMMRIDYEGMISDLRAMAERARHELAVLHFRGLRQPLSLQLHYFNCRDVAKMLAARH